MYSKTCLKGPLSKNKKVIFKTNYRLMQVKSLQNAPMGAFCNTFYPSLSYHLSLRSLFCLFLSGCLRQVLLYCFCSDRSAPVGGTDIIEGRPPSGSEAGEWSAQSSSRLSQLSSTSTRSHRDGDTRYMDSSRKIQR